MYNYRALQNFRSIEVGFVIGMSGPSQLWRPAMRAQSLPVCVAVCLLAMSALASNIEAQTVGKAPTGGSVGGIGAIGTGGAGIGTGAGNVTSGGTIPNLNGTLPITGPPPVVKEDQHVLVPPPAEAREPLPDGGDSDCECYSTTEIPIQDGHGNITWQQSRTSTGQRSASCCPQ